MSWKDLTPQGKRRIQRQICPICQKEIQNYQEFEEIHIQYGRNIVYVFMHTECLLSSQLERGFKKCE